MPERLASLEKGDAAIVRFLCAKHWLWRLWQPCRLHLPGHKENVVSSSIVINAPAKAVWDAVHTERQNDPDLEYSKVLEQHGNQAVDRAEI